MFFEAVDGMEHAPDGPGWYILATADNEQDIIAAQIVPRVRLSNEDAVKIAKVLDKFVQGKPLNWVEDAPKLDVSLEQAVAETTQRGTELVRTQLEEAREAVERLANLERRAKEFGIGENNEQ